MAQPLVGVAQPALRLSPFSTLGLVLPSYPSHSPAARPRSFRLCAGFVYSQILTACIELRLFDLLVERPLPLNDLAQRLGLAPEAALRLLKGCAVPGAWWRRAGRTGMPWAMGAALRGNPGIAEMVSHHGMLYRDLGDPVALLRRGPGGTGVRAYWAYAESERPKGLEACSTDAYTALMGDSQGLVAGDILDAYSLARHRRLLDLGGGNGTFLSAVGTRWPNLERFVFSIFLRWPSRRAVASNAREWPRAPRRPAGTCFATPYPKGRTSVL